MRKKAVVMSQVFIYIVAAIVFAVVLIFGYQAISGFLEKGEQVAFVTFKTDLESAVREVYSDFGKVVVYNERNPFSVPGEYERVCFLDLDYEGPKEIRGICILNSPDYHFIACDYWRSGTGWEEADQNVFLEPAGLGPIKVLPVKMDKGYACFPVIGGRIEMRLEGEGTYVEISEV